MVQTCMSHYYTDTPPASSDLAAITISTEGSDELTVNLTWSQNDSRCVVMYNAEVTSTVSFISKNTTSQYIELLLQIGVEYSFRVRGVDTTNRLGNWSAFIIFSPSKSYALNDS